jgi:hypothetical protein
MGQVTFLFDTGTALFSKLNGLILPTQTLTFVKKPVFYFNPFKSTNQAVNNFWIGLIWKFDLAKWLMKKSGKLSTPPCHSAKFYCRFTKIIKSNYL